MVSQTNLFEVQSEHKISREDIICALQLADSYLHDNRTIILCDMSSRVLKSNNFRATYDIDFAVLPDDITMAVFNRVIKETGVLFDFKAPTIIGLLSDYEDRLELIDAGTKYLKVYVLSLMDWVVSKLASNKLEDIWDNEEVTLALLYKIKDNFLYYAGIFDERAFRDLEYCIIKIKERDSNAIK